MKNNEPIKKDNVVSFSSYSQKKMQKNKSGEEQESCRELHVIKCTKEEMELLSNAMNAGAEEIHASMYEDPLNAFLDLRNSLVNDLNQYLTEEIVITRDYAHGHITKDEHKVAIVETEIQRQHTISQIGMIEEVIRKCCQDSPKYEEIHFLTEPFDDLMQ